jgi:hypothetical protein
VSRWSVLGDKLEETVGVSGRNLKQKEKSNVTAVTGLGDPYGFEASKILHFIDIRLTDGGEIVSITLRPRSVPRECS